MRTPLRLGLELPPLPLAGGDAPSERAAQLRELRLAAMRAEELGFATLWLGQGAEDGDPVADGCTLAASLAPVVTAAFLGVVMGPDGRHPSMAARDVTALDHVTGGRAALLLRYPQPGDAAAICRGMFTRPTTTVEGSVFHVAGAVNRPAPVQAGGPPLVAAAHEPSVVDDALRAQVDAVSAGGGAGEMAELEAALRAGGPTATAPDGGPALLWAGELPADPGEAARHVDDLRAAGVDGFICRLSADDRPVLAKVEAVGALVHECGLS